MNHIFTCSIFFFFFTFELLAEPISLTLAATEEEQKEMGLSDLTDEQKRAVENWLGAWTKRVLQASKSYHPSMGLNQWIQEWPISLQETPPKDVEEYKEAQKELSTLVRNVNGITLLLKNGSEWKIVESDRFNTRFWVRETPIEIKENPRDLSRPYILINRALNDQAGATKLKDASATPYEEPPGYFRGSFPVKAIEPGGQGISLINNSSWKVAPIDQLLVSTTWKIHDRIRVESSNDVFYPYRLNNLDSGSMAQAQKK